MKQPMVTGQDLIRAGYRPGEQFKDMLRFARQLHFSGLDREHALPQLMGAFPLPQS